jgi:hypothetical protein
VFGLAGSVLAYLSFESYGQKRDRGKATTPERAATGRSENGKDIERLRTELARMQSQIDNLRQRGEQKATETAAPKGAEPQELDAQALRAQREESARQWKDHMAEVAMDFEEEAVDRTFATTAKSAVEQELQNNPLLQAAAGKVECRTHTCRLEIRDARNPDVSKQLQVFVHKLGATLPRAQGDTVQGENGQSSLVLYMTDQEPVAQGPNK